MFKKFFSKKVVESDTLDFEKANPYNQYGRHRITELLSELSPYFRHDDCGEYQPIELGQLVLRPTISSYQKYKYRLFFKDVLLFVGEKCNNEYFGEWLHDGLWQDDITQNIKDFIQAKEDEKDTERIKVEQILSQYK